MQRTVRIVVSDILNQSTKVNSFVRFLAYTSLYLSHILRSRFPSAPARQTNDYAPHQLVDVQLLELLDHLIRGFEVFPDVDRGADYEHFLSFNELSMGRRTDQQKR